MFELLTMVVVSFMLIHAKMIAQSLPSTPSHILNPYIYKCEAFHFCFFSYALAIDCEKIGVGMGLG